MLEEGLEQQRGGREGGLLKDFQTQAEHFGLGEGRLNEVVQTAGVHEKGRGCCGPEGPTRQMA